MEIKPVEIKAKYGLLITLVIILFVILDLIVKGIKIFELIYSKEKPIPFILVLWGLSLVILWFIMNHLWRKEKSEHQKTRFDRDNIKLELNDSQKLNYRDFITGIPNFFSLKKTFESIKIHDKPAKIYQFILIDLKDFTLINNKNMDNASKLLRAIAQHIYKRMRRNESIFKYPRKIEEYGQDKVDSFFRLHTGGDEFVFLLQGSQSEGLGFVNRLAKTEFKNISDMTEEILGYNVDLSFHCSIAQIDSNTSLDEAFQMCLDGFSEVKKGKEKFNICWCPNTIEQEIIDPNELDVYNQVREMFNEINFTKLN